MTRPVASAAPAILLRSLDVSLAHVGRRKRPSAESLASRARPIAASAPGPCVASRCLTRYRPPQLQPRPPARQSVHEPDRPHSRPHGGPPPARQAAGDIGGAPMIVRVCARRRRPASGRWRWRPATRRSSPAVEAAGGRAVLTDPALPSGSDRILAALARARSGRPPRRGDQSAGRHAVRRARRAARLRRPAGRGAGLRHRHRSRPRKSDPADRTNPDVVKACWPWSRRRRPAAPSISPARPSMARGRSGGTSASTPIAARRWSGSPPRRPRRWSGARSWSSCAPWRLGLSIWAAAIDAAPISVDTPADLRRRARAVALTETRRRMTGRPGSPSRASPAPTATRPAAPISRTTSRSPTPPSRTPSRR